MGQRSTKLQDWMREEGQHSPFQSGLPHQRALRDGQLNLSNLEPSGTIAIIVTKPASVPWVYSHPLQDKLIKDKLPCICSDNESPFNVVHHYTDFSQHPHLSRGAWRALPRYLFKIWKTIFNFKYPFSLSFFSSAIALKDGGNRIAKISAHYALSRGVTNRHCCTSCSSLTC